MHLWSGPRPDSEDLIKRTVQELKIVRAEGYRLVSDKWGRRIKVELRRVLDHVAFHPTDTRRWQLIPTIIPTIKEFEDYYEKGRGFTYEKSMPLRKPKKPYPRIVFVQGVEDAIKGRVFASVVSPTEMRDIRSQRVKAGRKMTCLNPLSPAPIGVPETPGGLGRTARRLSGTASVPNSNNSTAHSQKSSLTWAILLALGLIIAGNLAEQEAA